MKNILFPLALVGSLFIAKPAQALEIDAVSTWDLAKNLAGRTVGTPVGAATTASLIAGTVGFSVADQTRKGIKIGSRVIGRGINVVREYKPKTRLVKVLFALVKANVNVAEEALYRRLADLSPRLIAKYKDFLGGEAEAVATLWQVAIEIDKLDRVSNIPEGNPVPQSLFELLNQLEYLQEVHDTIVDTLKDFDDYTDEQLEELTKPS